VALEFVGDWDYLWLTDELDPAFGMRFAKFGKFPYATGDQEIQSFPKTHLGGEVDVALFRGRGLLIFPSRFAF
jgi:hypothetical protein